MEAATLPQKKKLNKGKLKKTIKNVLCRPDPVFWPIVTDVHKNLVNKALLKNRISISKFKKPHWNELKLIPKEKRPKQPKIKKVDGLLFGISACCNAIQSGECSAVILEAEVNPRIIIQPILDTCCTSKTPVICLSELRKISAECFGIPTSSLGIRKNVLPNLTNEILEIAKCYKFKENISLDDNEVDMIDMTSNEDITSRVNENTKSTVSCPYLYRTNKKSRVFIPSNEIVTKVKKEFIGQDFIEVSKKSENNTESKKYMKMILKRIASNPNRIKGK
ncbi:uncharacterized protein LOC131847226 [Achroia grisella]|uniref:uncharacterized protein LOC131847226 n=1 Tax=Achroia grisella TaxID=688607 RepID=UPI0027D2CDB3|nr:uncharacterized protein LOC131847226 [Achroia grisella]